MTDEARADYPPMPKCDHAQDCICIEPDHAYCCGTARAAVLDSMTDEARAEEPRPSTRSGRAMLEDYTAGDMHPDDAAALNRWIAKIEREAAADLWQQGYAAGLERGRQPDNHPSESAPAVAPLGETGVTE